MHRRTLIKFLTLYMAPIIYPVIAFGETKYKNMLSQLEKASSMNEIDIRILGAHSCNEDGFSKFDNRAIIQAAIDYCEMKFEADKIRRSIIIPNGTFLVTATEHIEITGEKYGICSLLIKSNIIIKGAGTIKLDDSQYGPGAFFRLLSSYRNGEHIENVDIIDITINGNSEKQSDGVQASNILLECKENIKIYGVKSINCNGNGIQIRGGKDYRTAAKNIRIEKCKVSDCKKIGIQAAQFDGLKIRENEISNCNDNGIDIYGDMGKGTSPKVNGNNFEIEDNIISYCLNGIFPETVANGVIQRNTIKNVAESGIHINRIHGLPSSINIAKNNVSESQYGFTCTGDMRDVLITENMVSTISSSFIVLGGGRGNVSNIKIKNNVFIFSGKMEKLVVINGLIVRNIEISENNIYNSKSKISNICNTDLIENNSASIDHTVQIADCNKF
jgi:hypothetical protein